MAKDAPKRGGAWRTEENRTAGSLEVITLDPTQSGFKKTLDTMEYTLSQSFYSVVVRPRVLLQAQFQRMNAVDAWGSEIGPR